MAKLGDGVKIIFKLDFLKKQILKFNVDGHVVLRMFIGALSALFIGSIAFCCIKYFEPIITKPVELLGCHVYVDDINISNRLFACNIFLVLSFVTFLIVTFSRYSLYLAQYLSRVFYVKKLLITIFLTCLTTVALFCLYLRKNQIILSADIEGKNSVRLQVFYTEDELESFSEEKSIIKTINLSDTNRVSVIIPVKQISRLRLDFDDFPEGILCRHIELAGHRKVSLDLRDLAFHNLKHSLNNGALSLIDSQDDPHFVFKSTIDTRVNFKSKYTFHAIKFIVIFLVLGLFVYILLYRMHPLLRDCKSFLEELSCLKGIRTKQYTRLFFGLILVLVFPRALMVMSVYLGTSMFGVDFLSFIPCLKISLRALQAGLAGTLIWAWWCSPNKILPKISYYLQFLVLPYFVLLIPAAVNTDNGIVQLVHVDGIRIIALIMILVGAINIVLCRVKYLENGYLSTTVLLAIFIGICLNCNPILWLCDDFDPYATGQRITPYWMVINEGAKLFKDITTPYGLYDMINIWLGHFLLGELTIQSSFYGAYILNTIFAGLCFVIIRKRMPILMAFILAFLCKCFNVSWACVYIAVLINPYIIRNAERWIVTWLLLSLFYIFARTPISTGFVVASMPAVVYQFYVLYRANRIDFIKVVIFSIVLIFVFMIYPFGCYVRGYIYAFLERFKINSVFYGDFVKDFQLSNFVKITSYCCIVPILSCIVAYCIYYNKIVNGKIEKLNKFVSYFIVSFVLSSLICFVSYSFSRTDGFFSRILPIIASISFLLLMAVWVYCKNKKTLTTCITITLFVILFTVHKHVPIPTHLLSISNDIGLKYVPRLINGSDLGVGRLGNGLPGKLWDNELAIKNALAMVLGPGESFLDLTMWSEHYFISDRKCSIYYTPYFDCPGTSAQKRAVEILNQQNVKISLIDDSYFYKTPFNLRAYHLYRYALLSGFPWEFLPGKIMMMPKEYFDKIDLVVPNKLQALRILEKVFVFESLNFGHIPFVWGRGYKNFKKHLPKILSFEQHELVNIRSTLFWELPKVIKGIDGGLLYLNISDIEQGNSSAQTQLTVKWTNLEFPNEVNEVQFIAHVGINLIPLDSAPRWLLAGEISSITISSVHDKKFNIKQMYLLDRSEF
jgi:hypothetical protein